MHVSVAMAQFFYDGSVMYSVLGTTSCHSGANRPESKTARVFYSVCQVAAPVRLRTTLFGRVCHLVALG